MVLWNICSGNIGTGEYRYWGTWVPGNIGNGEHMGNDDILKIITH